LPTDPPQFQINVTDSARRLFRVQLLIWLAAGVRIGRRLWVGARIHSQAEEDRMLRFSLLLAVLVAMSPSFSFAQSGASSSPTQIAGVVQSFSGNTLIVKPATSPAVWVALPEDLRVDRSALTPGAQVSVEAHWADICYMATQVTVPK
jgi:hypothetical protein